MVHNIVTHHLACHLRGENPSQILMIVHGQGGTGKLALLNAILQTFADLNLSSLLAKTAMSGVAASIVSSQTLHSWTALPLWNPTSDKWVTSQAKKLRLEGNQTWAVFCG